MKQHSYHAHSVIKVSRCVYARNIVSLRKLKSHYQCEICIANQYILLVVAENVNLITHHLHQMILLLLVNHHLLLDNHLHNNNNSMVSIWDVGMHQHLLLLLRLLHIQRS